MNKLKFMVMDVDGTLTDGKIYMGSTGEVCKVFNCKDGYGIKHLLPAQEMIPVIITARKSSMVANRCEELGITEVYQGWSDKCRCVDLLLERYGKAHETRYDYSHCAYCGDDLVDLPCMKSIQAGGGVVGCPRDAAKAVKEMADYIAPEKGGEGAVRSFIEWLEGLSHV
jgi:3-deoxy-D-manno-octulosonate 8-phosphate phosphatase (KDO 8-P phosphatase)